MPDALLVNPLPGGEGLNEATVLPPLGLAYMAAITFQAPPSFIWAGFVLGLSAAALLLTARFNTISKKMIAAS